MQLSGPPPGRRTPRGLRTKSRRRETPYGRLRNRLRFTRGRVLALPDQDRRQVVSVVPVRLVRLVQRSTFHDGFDFAADLPCPASAAVSVSIASANTSVTAANRTIRRGSHKPH